MSDPRLRPEAPSAAPDPVLGVPVVPGAAPAPAPLAFPAVTSEGDTPLRVAAMSREEAQRRRALLDAAAQVAATTAPTPITVKVVRPAAPAEDAVDTTLRLAVLGMAVAVIAAMAWGAVQFARGLAERPTRIEITDSR